METNIKNLSKVLLMAISIFSMSIISSCSKDGVDGASGKDGVNGTNGQTGTANVIYSQWINQNWNTENGLFLKVMDVTEPRITTQIINNGYVLGFWKFSNQAVVYSLPIIFNDDSRNIRREMFYFQDRVRFTAARFNISLVMSDLWLNGDVSSGIPQYRYIIVPGGVSTSGRSATKTNYSKMSYQEICKNFNIPE
jgi:hypothetical protein